MTRIIGGVAVVLLVPLCVGSFLQGRPVTGKSSTGITEAFEAYGSGAFAADSANWLTYTGALLGLYIASWAWPMKSHARILTIAGITTAMVGSLASVLLLASYWSSGVPFRNFQAEEFADLQEFMYGISFVVPGITIAAAGIIGFVVLRSQKLKSRG